ncbi:MAG: hypothetical protein IJ563_07575 [Selenomonadaceae bacterium]|nr:hypothetical protein [Selenomonadaceae bacterium]MBR1858532.1 hypothetical protein [Selenomonadaceae bacterium]
MEIAPLIHSRTGQCDYNSKFAVRPKDFISNIQWSRDKILSATKNIDLLDGMHYLVASKDGVCIAGVVCTMKYFVSNCLTPDEQEEAKAYVDVQGRLYGVFLGYSFKGNTGEIPNISYSDMWQWFKNYLVPVWDRKPAETVEVPYTELDGKNYVGTTIIPIETFNNTSFYDLGNDEKLFEMYLSKASAEDVAFCSNVDRLKSLEDGVYTAVSTSQGIISRYRDKLRQIEEETLRKASEEEAKKNKSNKPLPPNISTSRHTQSNNSFPILKICILILIVIVMLVLLLKD